MTSFVCLRAAQQSGLKGEVSVSASVVNAEFLLLNGTGFAWAVGAEV